MGGHHFISYSTVDALYFVVKLHNALEGGHPHVSIWMDKHDLKPADDWDSQIGDAIRVCESLFFVLSPDSVEDQSICKDEWTRAIKYKKPIVPLRLHREAELPFRLGNLQVIDFTGNFDVALARLRSHLDWMKSPEGVLKALKDRLAIAYRDLRRAADPSHTARIQDDIAQLEREVAAQERVVADPEGTASRVEASIAAGLERERQPANPVGGVSRTKFLNPPPYVVPSYFQGRDAETRLIGEFLKDPARRLMTVVGRAGIGKTATVCRLLKALEAGRLPDDGAPLEVDGIIYLSAVGSRQVNAAHIFEDLIKLLPPEAAEEADRVARDAKSTTEAKMRALLEGFPSGCTAVLLDNFEDVVNQETLAISDPELAEALRALLTLPHHGVKAILTTRIAPRDLLLTQPGRQSRLDLGEGLPSPFAENILRAMDHDGKLGLRSAPDALLGRAREATRGFPRALEALAAILSADRDTSLQEVLSKAAGLLPDNVVEALVGDAFSRLGPVAQRVMQALAVFGRPAPPTAVDYVLQPYLPGVDSVPVLNRLAHMHFVRKEAGKYYLHPVDRAYAIGRLSSDRVADQNGSHEPAFTRTALLHRAADYFRKARTPRASWRTIEDLAPQLAEFELRCEIGDYETAGSLLRSIDWDYLMLWGRNRLVAELHERLLDKLNDPLERGLNLHRLGHCYADLGQTARAIEHHERALAIKREVGDRWGEGIDLGKLGLCYAALGQSERAFDYLKQGLAIDREIGNRWSESYSLCSLALAFVDSGGCEAAIRHATEAIRLFEECGDPFIASHGHSQLALARFRIGDAAGAREAAEAARRYDVPRNHHHVLGLIGLIALRQGDREAAGEAFAAAVAWTDSRLQQCAQLYDALDAKGLALAGLAVLEGGRGVEEAVAAFRAARGITKAAGVVGRVLRQIDLMVPADKEGMLVEVRKAAGGEG